MSREAEEACTSTQLRAVEPHSVPGASIRPATPFPAQHNAVRERRPSDSRPVSTPRREVLSRSPLAAAAEANDSPSTRLQSSTVGMVCTHDENQTSVHRLDSVIMRSCFGPCAAGVKHLIHYFMEMKEPVSTLQCDLAVISLLRVPTHSTYATLVPAHPSIARTFGTITFACLLLYYVCTVCKNAPKIGRCFLLAGIVNVVIPYAVSRVSLLGKVLGVGIGAIRIIYYIGQWIWRRPLSKFAHATVLILDATCTATHHLTMLYFIAEAGGAPLRDLSWLTATFLGLFIFSIAMEWWSLVWEVSKALKAAPLNSSPPTPTGSTFVLRPPSGALDQFLQYFNAHTYLGAFNWLTIFIGIFMAGWLFGSPFLQQQVPQLSELPGAESAKDQLTHELMYLPIV